jgi:hypothetical protein
MSWSIFLKCSVLSELIFPYWDMIPAILAISSPSPLWNGWSRPDQSCPPAGLSVLCIKVILSETISVAL